MSLTFPYRPYRKRIPHPPLSTTCFPCPSCGAETNLWCRDTHGREAEGICEARKAIYTTVHNQYVQKVKNGRLQLHVMTNPEIKQEIQTLIQEAITDYAK
ncbi:MAG: hypothetical protein OXH00_02900 [Candidatus Poribacteria bacterium]|nr:hypothetical protein [Candidatus Poribacteria bacterium]